MPSSHVGPDSRAPQSFSPQASVRGSLRWLPLVGAGLALVGLGAGIAGCARQATSGDAAKPAYSEQQVADAKKAVCGAFDQGMRSIRAAGARKPESPTDPFPVTAVNIRLAAIAVGNSFFHSIIDNPAAPIELIKILDELGRTYQDIALIQLADGQKADFDPLITKADSLVPQVEKLCQ